MGMETAPQCGWLIGIAALRELCPVSVAKMEQAHDFVSWAKLAETISNNGTDSLSPQLFAALQDLQRKFQLVTNGLELTVDYYDTDRGSKYDEIPDLEDPELAGCLFLIEGMTQPTPAGEALRDKITFVLWVLHGC